MRYSIIVPFEDADLPTLNASGTWMAMNLKRGKSLARLIIIAYYIGVSTHRFVNKMAILVLFSAQTEKLQQILKKWQKLETKRGKAKLSVEADFKDYEIFGDVRSRLVH